MCVKLTNVREYCYKVLKLPAIQHLIEVDFCTEYLVETAEVSGFSKWQTS